MVIKIKHNTSILDQDIIDQGPSKTGTSSAKTSFIQETLYQTKAYEELEISPVSFSLKNHHYGKINNKLLSLVPREEKMSTINVEKDLRVLDFVADAYSAFIQEMQSFKLSNKFSPRSKIYQFEAKGSKEDLEDLYSEFLSDQYSVFLDFVNNKKITDSIVDIDTFFQAFANFIDFASPVVPCNKSTFLLSNRVSRKVSGLVIDLDTGDFNDDKNKFENYISDEDYSCFQELCTSFGFVVNKDAPWQVIANLDSVNMKFYYHLRMLKRVENGEVEQNPVNSTSRRFEECKNALENFNLSDLIFNSNQDYYEIINYDDLNNLKILLINFFNSFVEYRPYGRQQIELEILENQKYQNKLIRLYVFMKAKEASMTWRQNKFEEVVDSASKLNRMVDNKKMFEYLQNEINQKNRASSARSVNFRF